MEQKNSPDKGSSAGRELTSWKEIAHYLGINIRTAQKWERERALPVRRIPGPRGRVSTEVEALESWRSSLQTRIPGPDLIVWPLGRGLVVELRFIGRRISPTDVQRLRDFLAVLRKSLVETE